MSIFENFGRSNKKAQEQRRNREMPRPPRPIDVNYTLAGVSPVGYANGIENEVARIASSIKSLEKDDGMAYSREAAATQKATQQELMDIAKEFRGLEGSRTYTEMPRLLEAAADKIRVLNETLPGVTTGIRSDNVIGKGVRLDAEPASDATHKELRDDLTNVLKRLREELTGVQAPAEPPQEEALPELKLKKSQIIKEEPELKLKKSQILKDTPVLEPKEEVPTLEKAMRYLNPETPITPFTVNDIEVKSVDANEKTPFTPKTPEEPPSHKDDILELTEEVVTKKTVAEQKAVMEEAQATYLEAYKDFHTTKKVYNVREPKSLRDLQKAYDEARLAFADTLDESVRERLAKKFEDDGGEDNPKFEALYKRYNNVVRFREVIRPSLERKLEARTEALSEKEKGFFGKGLEWVQAQNQKLEETFGKNGARLVRAVGTTALLAPVAFAGGTASALALAGWGGFRVGRSFLYSIAGGSLGTFAGNLYEKKLGRSGQKKAQEQLRNDGRDPYELTLERLRDIDASREKLTGKASEASLQKKKMLVRILTAFGVGAGTSAALTEWSSFHAATEAVQDTPVEPSVSYPNFTDTPTKGFPTAPDLDKLYTGTSLTTPPLEYDSTVFNSDTVTVSGGHEAVVTPQSTGATEVIVGKGEGADKLLTELQEKLQAQYAGSTKIPANIEVLLKTNPHILAQQLGLSHETGGIMLHPNDTVTADDHGRLIFHDSIHNKDVTLINQKGELHQMHGHKAVHHTAHTTPKVHKSIEAPAEKPVNTPALHEKLPPPTGEVTQTSTPLSGIKTMEEFLGEEPHIQQAQLEESHAEVADSAPTKTDGIQSIDDYLQQTPAGEPDVTPNQFGVTVDPHVPHAYTSGDSGVVHIFGGDNLEPRQAAEQYARLHPGTTVRFQAWDTDGLGGKTPYTGEFYANPDASGELLAPKLISTDGEAVPAPNPNTFTSVDDFTYTKSQNV